MGADGARLTRSDATKYLNEQQKAMQDKMDGKTAKMATSHFSEWLANYDRSDYVRAHRLSCTPLLSSPMVQPHMVPLEVPGQYSGTGRPQPEQREDPLCSSLHLN
jgi:hypothetical protein